MKQPMLKWQLIMFFAKELLWESQMSTQTTALSDLGEALIIHGFEANNTSLKRWVFLRTSSTKSGVMMPLPIECGSPIIFKYNLDLGRRELSIKSEVILLIFLVYFSIVVKSEGLASLLIMMLIPLFETQRKSTITSDLIFLRQLLMLVIC